MRAIILTCNTGEGHNSTAAAIKEAYAQHGETCDIFDSLTLLSEKTSQFICGWHTRIYRHAPKLFGTGYRYAESHGEFFEEDRKIYRYLTIGTDKLRALLSQGNYTTVICTHVISALMVTALQREKPLKLRTCFVGTDYTCSPITNGSIMDLYFIPHEDLRGEFVCCGIPEVKLMPVGIPVRRAFFTATEKTDAKRRLGLPEDSAHVLLMGGSMGCGPIEELTGRLSEALPGKAILTVLCGTNSKLLGKLESKKYSNVRLMGYTDQIPLLMDSADLYMTKPGGISVSESATKGLPLLLINAVGGCEDMNLRFFTKRGWADYAQSIPELTEHCVSLLGDRKRLEGMANALRASFQDSPAEKVYEAMTAQTAEAEIKEVIAADIRRNRCFTSDFLGF